jgi:hypothetical protein
VDNFPVSRHKIHTRNISELCKSLVYRHNLKNAGEDILAMFFTVEYDFDPMSIDLSGRNFAKTIAKDSGVHMGASQFLCT